jgi:hypothetical protein
MLAVVELMRISIKAAGNISFICDPVLKNTGPFCRLKFLRVLIFATILLQHSPCFWALLKSSYLTIPVSMALLATLMFVYCIVW